MLPIVRVKRASRGFGVSECIWRCDSMDKRYKEIKMSEIPDDLDIESLPEDVEIILDEEFPEMEDSYWED